MVVVAAGKWGHNMEVQEVHIVEAPYREGALIQWSL